MFRIHVKLFETVVTIVMSPCPFIFPASMVLKLRVLHRIVLKSPQYNNTRQRSFIDPLNVCDLADLLFIYGLVI